MISSDWKAFTNHNFFQINQHMFEENSNPNLSNSTLTSSSNSSIVSCENSQRKEKKRFDASKIQMPKTILNVLKEVSILRKK